LLKDIARAKLRRALSPTPLQAQTPVRGTGIIRRRRDPASAEATLPEEITAFGNNDIEADI
jgi:hypothetical protein